jgi:Zinc knuckle
MSSGAAGTGLNLPEGLPQESGEPSLVPRTYSPAFYNQLQQQCVDGLAEIYHSTLRGEPLLELARDILPLSLLFQPDAIDNQKLFRATRDLLKTRGGNYPTDARLSARSAVIVMLAQNSDEVDVYCSREKDWIAASTGATRSTQTFGTQNGRQQYNEAETEIHFAEKSKERNRKIGDSFARRFQSEESKYNGSADSDLDKVFNTFGDCRSDNLIDESDALRYAHNMFTGDAKRFYDACDQTENTTIIQLKNSMQDRFISPAAQSAISRELDSLTITSMMAASKTGPRAALDLLHSIIVKKGPLGEPANRTDRMYGHYLRKAVLSELWARTAAEEFVTDDEMTFSDLHQALISAIITTEEVEVKKARAYAESTHYGNEESDGKQLTSDPGVSYYGAQLGNFVHRPSSHAFPRSSPSSQKSAPRTPRSSDRLCFKCQKPGHFARECRSEISTLDAARARVQHHGSNRRAVSATLYEMCEDMDALALDVAEDRAADDPTEPEDEFSAYFLGIEDELQPSPVPSLIPRPNFR